MKRTPFLLLAGLLFSVPLVTPLTTPVMAQTPADIQQQAEAAFNEKSYERALELLAKAPQNEHNRYLTAYSLYKSERWDEAIAAATEGTKSAAWKARFFYLLGQIYVQVPHSGWKLGDKVWRQAEYPDIKDSDQKPVQTYFGDDDQKAALDNLENAKIEAQKERQLASSRQYFAPIYPLSSAEECDLNLDLAAYLPQTSFDDFIKSLEGRKDEKFDETIDLKQPYTRGWSLPKKVFYLYQEIRTIDKSDDKAKSSRSYLGEGLWTRSYRMRMDQWAPKWDETLKKDVVRPYPFDSSDPITPWRQLVTELPNSPLAPRALLFIAQQQEAKSQLVAAAATYRELVQKYGKDKLVSDARAAIARIEAKQVTFTISEPPRPGTAPKFQVYTHNLKDVTFTAYKVQLEKYLTAKDKLADPQTQFTSWTQNFGSIADARKQFGAPVATWNFTTKDNNDYQPVNGPTTATFSEIGAYAVIAESKGERFAQIVVISDLAMLKKSDKDGSFVYVCDAKTGTPIQGANVVLKETWYNNIPKTDSAQGTSDDGGFFDKKRSAPDTGNQVQGFAWVGNRYALTGSQGGYWYGYGLGQEARVLGTTDRPVYRPGQKVDFRQVITRRDAGGDWKPLVAKALTVTVNNPKGEQIWTQKLTTSEFGSINGEFTVPADITLGECSINVTDGAQVNGNTQFRVEEYKRPEFEVTVTAPKEAKRPGEVVAARINARYYFGAPVPNAKVKYTVRKSTWWASYHFPTPYEWLYSSWGVGDYDTGRRNIGGEGSGEIIKEGTVTTDASGFAELNFQTKPIDPADDNSWWARYSNPLYTIEAEVTDQSRRTIEAQGEVKVARQPYFAFLNMQRGYFQKGDRVPVELRTQDANEQSVAATGKMVVYRLLAGDHEEKVFEEPIKTDASGRTFWNWEATSSGQFRIEFVGDHEWGEEVKAAAEVWVVGEDIGQIRLQGVTILLDKRSYEQGETLKAAIVADKPGATVLFTQEASGDILRRDVYKIDGKSRIVEIPIEKKHVPNFFLGAALVQDYEVYQAQAEVFVPPTRQLLNLKVTGDKPVYKPGETGTFTVEARDWSGKPARAEVSLALIDASLFYIQKDYTPDIRQFYYGDRRANTVNLDSSRSGNPEARAEDDDKTPNYEEHGFDLPDDFGQLQLMPGGFGYYPYGGRFDHRFFGAARGGFAAEAADMAMPMPMAAPMASNAVGGRVMNGAMAKTAFAPAAPPPGQAPAQDVQIRSNFAETAYWSPAVVTNGGTASVKVTFPDSLTQWHATARGLTQDVEVGSAESDVATKKDLLVRLQAPRFFVERDTVMISADVHNYTDKAQKVNVNLTHTDELAQQALLFPPNPSIPQVMRFTLKSDKDIELAPNEEKRVDWVVKVQREGKATIQVVAKTATNSDGVKMSFPVVVHGAPVFKSQGGVMKSDGSTKINIDIPAARQMGSSQLNVQLNPSLAATMLDALPYLSDYPYGCVEQTMSRFLPSVLTEKTLRDAGINFDQLRARAKAYEAEAKAKSPEERVNNTGYTFPKGQPNSRDFTEMASTMWFHGRSNNPIFDAAQTHKMVQDGLNRLYSMQRSDGGWGWFPGAPKSDEYMSAYVAYGLYNAKKAGINVKGDVLSRAFNYLKGQMKDEDNLHLLTYIAYAMSQSGDLPGDTKAIVTGRLFQQRERLTPLSKSYLALTLNQIGEKDKANVLIRNLENTVKSDAANGTARYQSQPQWWCWWNNDTETVALALRAFLTVEPSNKLVPMFTKWLTLNSRGNHWRSTKETAEVVYTLAQYVTQNKELDVDYTLTVNLNGELQRNYHVNRDNVLFFDNRFITGDLFLKNGANSLTITKKGKGNLYWNAYTEYFSKEEDIKGSGNELSVTRKFYKLTRTTTVNDDQPADTVTPTTAVAPVGGPIARGRIGRPFIPVPQPPKPDEPEYTRTEIKDGERLKSGDMVEVELVVNAKNDYDYLIFEDMKAAGFEPLDVRSGYQYEDGLSSYVELRDEKVAFFVSNLPQGRHVLRYRVRAEVPGSFHALPTNGYAMYSPEVRATSDEKRIQIADSE